MSFAFTDDNFDQEALQGDMPVLVDFWAPWCGPCQMMAPIVDELAGEFEGRVKIGKLNVDENPAKAGQFGIMSIPTMLLFKNGAVAQQFVGGMTKEDLKAKIEANL
jgi:thioredoxin 1